MNESEVTERAEALPELYADRVRPEDLDGMRSLAGAGEWQERVDLVVASLGLTRAPVTAAERDELRSLLAAMNMPDDPITALNVEELAGGPGRQAHRRPRCPPSTPAAT